MRNSHTSQWGFASWLIFVRARVTLRAATRDRQYLFAHVCASVPGWWADDVVSQSRLTNLALGSYRTLSCSVQLVRILWRYDVDEELLLLTMAGHSRNNYWWLVINVLLQFLLKILLWLSGTSLPLLDLYVHAIIIFRTGYKMFDRLTGYWYRLHWSSYSTNGLVP